MNDTIKPLSWLVGSWESENGCGSYPTIKAFQYHEKLTFTSCGQPMLNYSSESRSPGGKTMHLETGFLRIKPGTNHLCLILSHNFGLTTLEEGSYDSDNKLITLASESIERMSFSKGSKVCKTERRYKLNEDGILEYRFYMGTDTTELQQHLVATYKKVES